MSELSNGTKKHTSKSRETMPLINEPMNVFFFVIAKRHIYSTVEVPFVKIFDSYKLFKTYLGPILFSIPVFDIL
jgi:hypothetical protein